MPPTPLLVGWATMMAATLVLRFATIALLRRLEEAHTVLWSASNLPESAAQRGYYRAPGVDWRVQRFIWSKRPLETGDPIVQRRVRVMRIASMLLIAGFLIMIASLPASR